MKGLLGSLVLFVSTFAVYFTSEVITQMDSRWTLYVAWSVLRDQDLNLDEFAEVRDAPDTFDITTGPDGHRYWNYPIGTPLLVLPGVWLAEKVGVPLVERWPRLARYVHARTGRWPGDRPDIASLRPFLELLFASAIVALAVVGVFWVLRTRANAWVALLATLLIAFGTTCWSTASRSLWQHGPSMLMLVATLLCLVRAERTPFLASLAGLPLAFAYVCRPTNAISVLVLSLFVLLRHPRQMPRFLLLALVVAAPYCLQSWITHGSMLPLYFRFGTESWGAPTREFVPALAAQWVSTGRGLLVFSPFLALAVWAIVRRDWRELRSIEVFLIAIVVAHTVAIAIWPCWWAGHSFGPRLMTDVLPYLAWFLVAGLERVFALRGTRRTIALVLVALASAFGVAVHSKGANEWQCWYWNDVPNNVNEHTERVWSLRDPQVLSGWLR